MLKIALLTAPLLLTLPAAMWASNDSCTVAEKACVSIGPLCAPVACNEIPSVFAMTNAEAHDYQRQNLEHVKLGMSQAREHVAQLTEARRLELREATGYVVQHCPYTRATIELVQLMRDSAREAQAAECSGENAALTLLVRTLDEHWSLLEDIGAALPPVAASCGVGTQARFEALYETLSTVSQRSGALDDETRKRLGTANARAARETANLWNSKPALMDYDKWMAKADAAATSSALAAARRSFGHAVKLYMTLGC